MNHDHKHWIEIDRIFAGALDLPPDERADFIEHSCQGDAVVRAEVLALLDASEDPAFLEGEERGPLQAMLKEAAEYSRRATSDPDPLLGATLGAHRVVRLLGHGGMGSVYLAERTSGFDRHVAIKTLRRGIETEDVVRRFLTERQILAQLNHPNIARLFDGGTTPDGRPYFVMEYVPGEPVTEYADARQLGVRARLELVQVVAAALQHLHQHLVVHGDVKPSNVMVTAEGMVKLLDFGIARLIGSEHRWGQTRTSTGIHLLTPAYAAPEQVSQEPATTATDVYQLGALFYELVTGVRPFSSELSERQLEKEILEVDPEPPSRAARRPGGGEPHTRRGLANADDLARQLRGDLDGIAATALAKEPARRYSSAERLAEDIDRHLRGLTISARTPTVRYRFGRFLRRNPWFIPVAAAATLLLGLYLGSLIRHDRQLTAERNLALAEAERAEAVTSFLTDLFESSDPWAGGEGAGATVLDALDQGARRVGREFADRPGLQARLFGVIGGTYFGLNRVERAEPLQRSAAALLIDLLGPESQEAMEAVRALAATLHYSAGPDSALALLEPIWKRLELPSTHREEQLRAEVLADMAWAQWALADLDSARALYEYADRAFEGLDPPDPERQGAILRHHARLLGFADRKDEQVALARRALTLLESALPSDHIELAAAREDVAVALAATGRDEEALVEFRRAQRTFEERLEPDDPNLLIVRNNAGLALLHLGRLAEAEAEYRVVAQLYQARDGDSKEYADAIQNLAAVLKADRRFDEAVELSLRAHEIYRKELGKHYLTAFPLLTIAQIELDRGRASEGLRMSSEAYGILTETLPEGHYASMVALCRRGRARWALDRSAPAFDDLETATAALEQSSLGRDHEYVIECREALKNARESRDRPF